MVLMLCVGTWLWSTIDPADQLFEEQALPAVAAELVSSV